MQGFWNQTVTDGRPSGTLVRRSLAIGLAIGLLLLGMSLLILLCNPAPVQAASKAPESLPLLTLETLQQRLKSPVPGTPLRLINLRRFTIDLRSENQPFRDEFYRLLRSRLQPNTTTNPATTNPATTNPATTNPATTAAASSQTNEPPISLDLGSSKILGDFDLTQLGQRVSLYAQVPAPLKPVLEEQLQRDRRRLLQLQQLSRTLLGNLGREPSQITTFSGALLLMQTQFEGTVNWSNTFFSGIVQARGAEFLAPVNATEARFQSNCNFSDVIFRQEARFRNSLFLEKANFNQVQFKGATVFQGTEFREVAGFNQSLFSGEANFSKTRFQDDADFSQTRWQEIANFSRSRFNQALFLTNATPSQALLFRQAQFERPINLRGVSLNAQADFSDATFACRDSACRHPIAYINLAGLRFDSPRAAILGNPGQIGRILSIPNLQDNQTVLRNLVRNFRQLQQVSDANEIEYMSQRLRLKSLRKQLLGVNINTASEKRLQTLDLSDAQILTILEARTSQKFRDLSSLLNLDSIDLATYIRIRDRIVTTSPFSPGDWLLKTLQTISLSLLLLLSRYGSDVGLTLGCGLVAIAYFSVLFWLSDRVRPPQQLPPWPEAIAVFSMFTTMTTLGVGSILRTAPQPWLTLMGLALVIGPVPIVLLGLLLQQERRLQGPQISYLVEDGSMRQLRIFIGRLPVVPRFPLFRDRYMPILWERQWGWLNYYDFSLNNWLRFGFNDVRLRDTQLPGLVSALVWYQWSIGLLYVALLLWTLSRTIPGLNLLIYFR